MLYESKLDLDLFLSIIKHGSQTKFLHSSKIEIATVILTWNIFLQGENQLSFNKLRS